MKLHEREALTEEALRRWRSLDHELVWGRFHAVRSANPNWDLSQTWEELRLQISDYAKLMAVFDQLNKSIPQEPWSNKDIDTILDVLAVKAVCFRSGYQKERICNRLKKYRLSPVQASRLQEIFFDYILNRLSRREVFYLCRLVIPYADSRTVLLLEAWENETESPHLKRKCIRMRAMILNQRRDLR